MATLARFVLLLAAAFALTGHPTSAGNRQAAYRDAGRLLRLVVLPPGARPLGSPPGGAGGQLRGPYQTPSGNLVDRHRLWQVPERLDAVVAFVRSHRPQGSLQEGSGSGSASGPRIPANETLFFALPAQPGTVSTRSLDITMVALPDGSTGVRVDAQDVWIVPRPPSEVVPAAVREVDVGSHYVTGSAEVATIVRWFDALPIVQPRARFSCPMLVFGPAVELDFRSGNGALLAQARMPMRFRGGSLLSTPCTPIQFSIGRHRETPLVGGRFFRRVERLLGVRFA
jgi:hypothetical protein